MLNVENKKIKILVIGDFASRIHEEAIYNAFVDLGMEMEKFSTVQSFRGYITGTPKGFFAPLFSIYYKFQNKFGFGPAIFSLNRNMVLHAKRIHPDLIFVYRGKHVFKSTIRAMKKTGALVFGYNNDDPFSPKYPAYFWRHFKKSIPAYDHIFVYRKKNIDDYRNLGYLRTSLLRSYYISNSNYQIQNLEKNKYTCDVSFVGHFENDGRDEYIKAIIDAGIDFQLHGPEWERSKFFDFFRTRFGEMKSLGTDYNVALNSAKIALVFLSKLNSDTYTRRCFEIPAAGAFMLSEYSEDLASLFAPGKEADYFSTKDELIEKIKYYLAHDDERKKIAAAGHERLMRDGHDVVSRAKEILEVFKNYQNT